MFRPAGTSRLTIIALLRTLWHHRLARQSRLMLFWALATRSITFFTSVWMIRCMGPENLGISGTVLGASSVVALFSNLGLDIVGVRRISVNKENAKELIQLVVGLRTRLSFAYAAIWLLCVLLLVDKSPTALLPWLLGAPLIITASLNTSWILQGLEEVPLQTRSTALSALLAGGIYCAFFRPGMPAGADLAVIWVTTLCALIYNWSIIRQRLVAGAFGAFNWSKALTLLWDARGAFGIVLSLAGYLQLDVLFVAYFRSAADVGEYRCALTLIGVVTTVTAVVPTLLYPRFAVWHRQGARLLWSRQIQITALLSLVGLLLSPVVLFASRPMFHILFGLRFDGAVTPFILLAIASIIVLINGVFAWALIAAGRDGEFFMLSVATSIVSVVVNLLVVPTYGITGAAATRVGCECMILLGCFWCSWRYVANHGECGVCSA